MTPREIYEKASQGDGQYRECLTKIMAISNDVYVCHESYEDPNVKISIDLSGLLNYFSLKINNDPIPSAYVYYAQIIPFEFEVWKGDRRVERV